MSAPESDWSRLSPRRPIEPDGAGYVVRPWFGAQAIVEKVRATGGAWLVVGAAGSGKSSELACAAKLWRDDKRGLALLARIDRVESRAGGPAERLAVSSPALPSPRSSSSHGACVACS